MRSRKNLLFLLIVFAFLCSFLVFLNLSSSIISPEYHSIVKIALVVASRGGTLVDDETPETLDWIPSVFDDNNYKEKIIYQRRDANKSYHIPSEHGYECLSYIKYIVDNYNTLPNAVIFVHADASRHCPFIRHVLLQNNKFILDSIHQLDREIVGYIPLTKLFVNQTKKHIEVYQLNLINMSNYITNLLYINDGLSKRIQYHVHDYPAYVTTYITGSFIVSKENIQKYSLNFYEMLLRQLYAIDTDNMDDLRTCGKLEYLWTTMWGGQPFAVQKDPNRWCGPLFTTDITIDGFMFTHSEDGSIEKGIRPDGYK